jgi:hypothetical protein
VVEFEKLYDEEWWYWHLEDRRRGGAPPDAFLRGDELENGQSSKDAEGSSVPTSRGKKLCDEIVLKTPLKGSSSSHGSGRFRVPATGLAAPDMAAGGTRHIVEAAGGIRLEKVGY